MPFAQAVSRILHAEFRTLLCLHFCSDTRTAIFAKTVENMESVEALDARHPLRGVGRPGDLVGAAIFLASADSAWITGVNLPVDGGYLAQ